MLESSSSNTKHGVIKFGNARFTVVTPYCIRLEYSDAGKFIDAPSWFAVRRDTTCVDYDVEETGNGVIVKTKALTLTYIDDGRSFAVSNLRIVLHTCSITAHWRFGQRNQWNMGGALQTLDNVYTAQPLPEGLLSRDGWYYLDDSSSHLFVGDWIEPRPEGSGSDGYFFGYGDDYKIALQSLARISGSAPLPRKCILGSWYSRWYSYTAEDYINIVREFEEHDFPLDILVLDMEWHRKDEATIGHGWAGTLGWSGWSWNKALIPNPEGLLQWCHDQNLTVTLNVHPHDGIRSHEDCYENFMTEMGLDPEKSADLPFLAGNKRYMDAYFNAAHKPLEKQGVDFWWVDWQQDRIMPFADGIENMKHLPLLNHCYYQHSGKEGKRGLSFSRWAGWGDQRYPIHFSGDANSSWNMLSFEIYFTATSGNVGCFFWSHDIGGFHGERDPELYARWVQFGITTAALRLHSTGEELDRRPWKWGSVMESSMRESFKLRSRLIPYIYSSMHQCHEQSLPLNRPMYIEHPDVEAAYNLPYQYFLGDGFLVAPVVVPGCGDRLEAVTTVWLPEGVWINWFTGEYTEGPCTIDVVSDIDSFPLFVRGSFPVAMQSPTNRMTSQALETLIVKCFHSSSRQVANLYEDDGESDKYLGGEYAITELSYAGTSCSAEMNIAATDGSFDTQQKVRSYQIELTSPPIAQVLVNGVSHDFEQDDMMAVIRIDQQDIRMPQCIVLTWK